MRVIGGRHRGRRLIAPPGEAVRPTSDRAREALFNILSHGDFAVAGLPFAGENVLDAFAGTGAIGIEALSRGAANVAFIETDRAALSALRRNLALLDEEDTAHVTAGDATRPPRAPFPSVVAFLDPPYRSGLAAPALTALTGMGWLTARAIAVVEISTGEAFSTPDGFTMIDERKYGAAKLIFLRREGASR
jgi:16S rRNA (guanine966-N2)-methyltransferase